MKATQPPQWAEYHIGTKRIPNASHTCPKDLRHVDLRMTIYKLRIKSKWLTPFRNKRKLPAMIEPHNTPVPGLFDKICDF